MLLFVRKIEMPLYIRAEITFGVGPLGIQIASSDGNSPPFTIHGFHGKMNDFGKFEKSAVEACGAVKIEDEVVRVAGEDVTKCTYRMLLEKIRISSRPLTVAFARWSPTPPLGVAKVDLRTFVVQAPKRQTSIRRIDTNMTKNCPTRKEVNRYVHELYRDVSIGDRNERVKFNAKQNATTMMKGIMNSYFLGLVREIIDREERKIGIVKNADTSKPADYEPRKLVQIKVQEKDVMDCCKVQRYVKGKHEEHAKSRDLYLHSREDSWFEHDTLLSLDPEVSQEVHPFFLRDDK